MAEGVIVWNSRDPLNGRSPEDFEAELRRLLAGRAIAAYLFGSYGTPEFGRDSDVDLIIVAETERPFVERPLDYSDLIGLVPDMDLLVYTPAEFAQLTTEPSPGFWTSVVASMRRIA
jgi:NADPH-dependent 2,4-dienoyl-CoA reductase/sulfur reductase-like enzyme